MSISITQNNQKPPISSSILGIIMVIVVEMMFFGGLISAFVLAKAGKVEWPPLDQPRLPFVLTFTNLIILLISAYFTWSFLKDLKNHKKSNKLLIAIVLGGIFLLVQGYEWIRILLFGMETSNSLFSSFFYTIIGLHGFHVFIGLILLIYAFISIKRISDEYKKRNLIMTVAIFWFFVVALWPILYYLIYWTR